MGTKIKLSKEKVKNINANMIGLFFEDINFAADGGLYAELLENRSFEAVKSLGGSHDYVMQGDYLYAWSLYKEDGSKLLIDENSPINEKNPHYVRFIAENAGSGFKNKGYDGILINNKLSYKVSFYAREVKYLAGDIEVFIAKNDKIYARNTISFVPAQPEEPNGYDAMVGNCKSKEWKQYETVLTVDCDSDVIDGCEFVIALTQPGQMEFDIISLIPMDAIEGIFRADLYKALYDLKPGFLRFPGGCIVEGTSLMRRYRWKDTIGDIKDRKINTNLWATQGGNVLAGFETPDCHYMQSYGIGFYEYFRLCELLSTGKRRCEPLPVLNIGVACQFRSYETVDVDSEEFEEYIKDALDLIEFANGPVDSKYGSIRAKMGHPESFNMSYLAIGNEQWNSPHVDLNDRYKRFEKAIHEVYPEIKCLGTAGPFIKNEMHAEAWSFYRDEIKTNPDFSYAVDEHYYVAPSWLYENVNMYDDYPRDIAVFAGEYAGHDENLGNSMESALAEAAMLTGMEKNGDVVKLASYAPLFNRIGHTQWAPDMIWFDESKVILTPSYYVQQMFSVYAGDCALDMKGQEKTLQEHNIYISMVESEGKTILKLVNANEEERKIELEDEAGNPLSKKIKLITLESEGKYKAPKPTAGIDPNGPNKAIPVGTLTNREICELRKPDAVKCVEYELCCDGNLILPPKSLVIAVV